MSSASSGRYQSKLFNFFHQHSQRITSSVGQTWRKVKVATNWSLEALLYPVFLLIQKAVDSAGKQLNQQVQSPQVQLKSGENQDEANFASQQTLIVDKPIVHLLEMVRNLPSRQDTSSLNSTAEKIDYIEYHQTTEINETVKNYLPKIQGIATHLKNRHLVLVTSDNKILDILTLKQQQKLQDKIISEIAEYWHHRALLSAQQSQNTTNFLPEINQLLNKLTGKTEKEVEIKPYIDKLDSAIAKLEATTFSPISQRATLIGKTLKQQLDSFIFGKGKQTTSPSIIPLAITSWSQRITHLISNQKITNINLDNSKSQLPVIRQTLTQKISRFIPNSQITTQNATEIESQTPKVLDLIQQAIYYFFGFQSTPKLHTSQNLDTAGRKTLFSKSVKAALPQSDYQDETEDLWLTFGDLFGEEIEISTEVTTETSQPQLNSRKPNSKLLKEYQTGGNLVKNRSKNQSSIVNQSSEKQKSRRITLPKPEKTVISPSSNSKTAVKPDYIEIDATTVSYEKHPVELILEWLDLIILWVEERIAIVFRFLQRLFGA